MNEENYYLKLTFFVIWWIKGEDMRKVSKFLLSICSVFFFSSCSTEMSSFVTSYSSCPSLAIMEGMTWNKEEVKILLANLYYSKCYNGQIDRVVYYDYVSITVSMHNSKDEELYKYNVDIEEYSSRENGILLHEAYRARASDFKLKYTFDLNETITEDTEDVYFLITYVERYDNGDTDTFGTRFNTTVKRKNNGFSLSKVRVSPVMWG